MEAALANLTKAIEGLNTRMDSLEKRLAATPCASGAAAPAAAAPCGGASEDLSPAEQAFVDLLDEKFKPLVEAGKKISPVVSEQMEKLEKAYGMLRALIGAAAKSKKPEKFAEDISAAAQPLFALCGEIAAYKDKCFREKQIEHISGISEAALLMQWVTVEPKPVPFLNDMIPSAEFHFNRVMRDTKDKADLKWQWQWAKDFVAFLRDMANYVKTHHTTGLAFRGQANLKDVLKFDGAAAAPAPAAAAKPAEPAPAAAAAAPKKEVNTGALFSELNRGTGITGGLKHVSADMKTKNRPASERSSVVPASVGSKTPAKAAAAAPAKKVRPPAEQRSPGKWVIENFVDTQKELADTHIQDMIYIGSCKNCTFVIKGKVKGITIDNCTKVGVVCDECLSLIEVVNSNSCQLQITQHAPCVNIDKCSCLSVYLSRAAINPDTLTKVYTSKSSNINVNIPGKTDEDDMIEMAVPEQFCSTVVDGKLVTELSSMQGM